MSFDKLERNIVSVIKESQAKLGYEKMPLGINYIKPFCSRKTRQIR